ncbi:hypothetical protein P885DRAFT_32223, partial [Corynascus similis CBS 632.67]
LRELCTTDPRHDKARIEQTKGGLLEESYCWVLDNADFRRWRNDAQSRLLWIKGDPGKGKTMLLCGIINELNSGSDSSLLSFFFCQAPDPRINNATAVLRGLTYLLVAQQPSLISHIQKYDAAGYPVFRGVNAWIALSETFIDILEDPTLPPIRLVIDALDECIEGLDLLLNLVVQTSVYPGVKWIVSSRYWPTIEKKLDATMQKLNLSLELNEESVSTAVTAYIRFKVAWLAEQNGYNMDTRDVVERYLSVNAHGTFLWVALVCQELANIYGWEVEEWLETFPPGLDALYRRMMDHIHRSRHTKLVQRVLGAVAVVYRPITLQELPTLVDTPCHASGNAKALAEIVGLCGSFLTLREHTIFFIHQSAKDFLLQQARNEIFLSGIEDIHYTIFSRSLRAMQKILRCNIYQLGSPGISIDKVTPPNPDPLAAISYSCVYWVNHLQDCNPKKNANKDLQDNESIDVFLREKCLHWLEALSLLRCMGQGIASILKLEELSKEEKKSTLISLVRDIYRFSLYHKWAIENTPLQVYTSALIFSPGRSIVRNEFKEAVPKWIIQKPTMADTWSACVQTLQGHRNSVFSVVWSHDTTRLASASGDKTVKIWDAVAGQCVSTLEGHNNFVTSVAWSHDTTRLASASVDKTVKIWDPATGQCVSTLEGHSKSVISVDWSDNTTRLASASVDKTVKIWDPATGQCVSTLEGHSNSVFSVAWSHDTTRLASASADKTVKIWDPATGQCVSTLESHGDSVFSVAWSHNTTRLASASVDETVKIWDPTTGQCVSTLEGHSDSVTSVAWSDDMTRLASTSWDKTVKIWDPATGQCVSTLEGHSNFVTSVVWSDDKTQLASASWDKTTVKIWDPATGQCILTLHGHSDSVTSVAWSDDATRLASASDDGTVKIWDPVTGQCLSTINVHNNSVNAVAWSHSTTLLISATDDGTIKIWDPTSGQCMSTVNIYHSIDHFQSRNLSADRLSTNVVGYGLSNNNTWITYRGENLIWLPPEYRASSFAVSGTAVSIGCFSGRVLIFEFSDGDPII